MNLPPTIVDPAVHLLGLYSGELEALDVPEIRRTVTHADPMAFALTYLWHHLASEQTHNEVTLSPVHVDWARKGRRLIRQEPFRRAFVGPREMGKSTWWFLIVPLWAAAHGHTKFVAAFADSSKLAETHLATFLTELRTNERLRDDFPDLCTPLVTRRGITDADRADLYRAKSGFVFAARGMESQALGLKIGNLRPDLLILDDVEPAEERYSADLTAKRLATLQDTVLPLNDRARVVFVGTVTRADSILHQLVRVARGQVARDDERSRWIDDDRWEPFYYAPIVTEDDGARESIWPARWPLEDLERIEHTRSYMKNYLNDPLGLDGAYWVAEDFRRGELEGVTRTLLSIDPAVTTKQSSDYTGLAVIEYAPGMNPPKTGRCRVKRALRVKLSGADLRRKVMDMLNADPAIGLLLIETNQGGEVWPAILHDIPVKLRLIHQTVKKEVRAAEVLNLYQTGHVVHAHGLTDLETEQVGFPRAPHDDLVDAVGTGIIAFLDRKKAQHRRPVATQLAYV
jgi:phage terminase large subunit-like protein